MDHDDTTGTTEIVMGDHSAISTENSAACNPVAVCAGVVLALVFPSIVTWVYFVLMASSAKGIQGLTYSGLKGVQFLFPLVWTLVVLKQNRGAQGKGVRSMFSEASVPVDSAIARRKMDQTPVGGTPKAPSDGRGGVATSEPRPSPGAQGRATLSRASGIVAGVVFGLAITLSGWLVYRGWLHDSPLFATAAEKIRAKIAGFGLDSVAMYAALALFYSLVHSFLEEYYWRWFVFGQLRRLVPVWPAIVVSAIGFMAHHVIILGTYFDGLTWMTALLSAAVAIGGAFWAWLYQRSGSLYGPWVSHLLVDAGIFLVGYDLVRGML